MRPKALLLLVALLAFVQGAKADDDIDDDIFEYEDDAKTIIVDLVMGQNPTTITIPASVEEVKEGAFAYATNLEELYIKGDPYFDPNAFERDGDVGGRDLYYLNLGSNMSPTNIQNLIISIGTDNALETIDLDGYTGNRTMKWTAGSAYLSAKVEVHMPAEIANDEVFGSAQVWGRFTLDHDLVTFCGKQSFGDVDNSNFLFYVAQELQDGSVYIKRVPHIYNGQGILIHNASGTATVAYIPRDMDLNGQSYGANMLVGVTEPTTIGEIEGDKTNFVLYEGKFYPTSGGTLGAGRAYLQVPTSEVANLSNLAIVMEDEEDGIGEITRKETARQRVGWFTIGGQRLNDQPQQAGIYVHNGRLETVK